MATSNLGRAWTQLVRDPSDLAELRELLGDARGRVREVGRGFADEMLLDIESPEAQWLVGTQASEWRLLSGADVLATSGTGAGSRRSADLSDAELSELDVDDGLDLIARFRDGRTLLVQCKAYRSSADDPPCWEVFTPGGLVVTAGPGHRWSAAPADVPERDVGARQRSRSWGLDALARDMRVPIVLALLSWTVLATSVIGRPAWVTVPVAVAALIPAVLLLNALRVRHARPDDPPKGADRRQG